MQNSSDIYPSFTSGTSFFFEERHEYQWVIDFKESLYEAIELKRNLTPIQYLNPILQRDKIIERLSIFLLTSVPKNRKDLCVLHKRIHKYKEYFFTFLLHDEVPPRQQCF
jgi:hypothetical protein